MPKITKAYIVYAVDDNGKCIKGIFGTKRIALNYKELYEKTASVSTFFPIDEIDFVLDDTEN